MKLKLLSLVAIIGVVVFASCSKSGKTGLLVPEDAAVVVTINSQSLSEKITWQEVQASEWYKELQQKATNDDTAIATLVAQPEKSGIDIKAGFAFFMKSQNNGGYMAFQGKLTSAGDFETAIKNLKKDASIQKKDDLSYTSFGDDAILTWNSSRFIFIADAPMNLASQFTGSGRSTRFGTDSLLIFAKNTYGLSGKKLLDSDKRFADLVTSKGDLHYWISAEKMYNNSLAGGFLSMMKFNSLIEGNISTGTLSFENGKIALGGEQFYGKELAKVMDKHTTDGVSGDVVNRLPSGDALAAGVYKLPVAMIVDIVRLAGADGIANSYLGQHNLTLDEIAGAFKGDMAFALTGIEKKSVTNTYEGYEGKMESYTYERENPKLVFGISIVQDKFKKLYDMFMKEMGGEKPKEIFIKNEKDWFVVGTDSAAQETFITGNNKPNYADKLKGHNLNFFVNIPQLMNAFQRESSDSIDNAMLNLSKATWLEFTANADYKKGKSTYNLEVLLSDKSVNSLKQINKYADQMNALEKKKREAWDLKYEDMAIDTVVAAPQVLVAPPPPPAKAKLKK
jgi:hypothetical protein